MPVLKNVKHEKFAQELAKGETHRDAYENAGFKRHESNYLRLTRDPKVRGRIDEILGAAAHKAEVSIEKVLKELALIGFANMGDYLRIGEDGEARLDMSELTSDHAAAIGEFVVEEYKEGRGADARDVRRTRFKLSDKHAALVSIGKHLGMFKDRTVHENPDGSPLQLGAPVVIFNLPDNGRAPVNGGELEHKPACPAQT